MRLPLGWLRDYLDFTLGTDEVAARFAALGFPVEEIERRPHLSGVVIGRLTSLTKHSNADRLQICTVDVGVGAPLSIVTAADNVAEGQIVPVATLGAELVGKTIGPRAMRGVDSQGMLCSADELGLPAEWFEDGIIQLELDAPVGADAIAHYRLADDVLDVEVTANRVDAMAVIGLARELGAALGATVHDPSTEIVYTGPATPADIVTLESPDCRRFVAQRFSNLAVRPAPFWMRVRLALAGQRPIDNLVDVSNFVMLETGQPLHFYDFATLAGGRLIVRDAQPGEKLVTLDGEERTLDPSALVIADEKQVQCIAGLRGAASSEVSDATRELLLEAASFSGPRIRRTSIALGLRTDASSRHEKGLPSALADFGAARAATLLQREGAVVYEPIAAGAAPEPPPAIRVTASEVRSLLGMLVDEDEIDLALRGLGFGLARDGDAFLVTPPSWRGDVRIREDVIEEIGRVVGYDRIASAEPPIQRQNISSGAYSDERRTAAALAAQGYREAVSLSLQPASVRETYARAGVALPGDVVEIQNPLSEDQRYLRFSLVPSLLALVGRYESSVPLRFFEIGHVFFGSPEPLETAMAVWLLALAKRPAEPTWRDGGFLEFKAESLAIVRALAGRDADTVTSAMPELHPGKAAALLVGEDVVTFGAVDPRLLAVYAIESDVYVAAMRMSDLPAYRPPQYVAPSRFPAIERDLALVVAPEVPALDIQHAVRAGADGVIADVRVFDEYRGPQVESGKKSIAVRVVLQRRDATLTDAEAERHVAAILASLRERCGAKIRE